MGTTTQTHLYAKVDDGMKLLELLRGTVQGTGKAMDKKINLKDVDKPCHL